MKFLSIGMLVACLVSVPLNTHAFELSSTSGSYESRILHLKNEIEALEKIPNRTAAQESKLKTLKQQLKELKITIASEEVSSLNSLEFNQRLITFRDKIRSGESLDEFESLQMDVMKDEVSKQLELSSHNSRASVSEIESDPYYRNAAINQAAINEIEGTQTNSASNSGTQSIGQTDPGYPNAYESAQTLGMPVDYEDTPSTPITSATSPGTTPLANSPAPAGTSSAGANPVVNPAQPEEVPEASRPSYAPANAPGQSAGSPYAANENTPQRRGTTLEREQRSVDRNKGIEQNRNHEKDAGIDTNEEKAGCGYAGGVGLGGCKATQTIAEVAQITTQLTQVGGSVAIGYQGQKDSQRLLKDQASGQSGAIAIQAASQRSAAKQIKLKAKIDAASAVFNLGTGVLMHTRKNYHEGAATQLNSAAKRSKGSLKGKAGTGEGSDMNKYGFSPGHGSIDANGDQYVHNAVANFELNNSVKMNTVVDARPRDPKDRNYSAADDKYAGLSDPEREKLRVYQQKRRNGEFDMKKEVVGRDAKRILRRGAQEHQSWQDQSKAAAITSWLQAAQTGISAYFGFKAAKDLEQSAKQLDGLDVATDPNNFEADDPGEGEDPSVPGGNIALDPGASEAVAQIDNSDFEDPFAESNLPDVPPLDNFESDINNAPEPGQKISQANPTQGGGGGGAGGGVSTSADSGSPDSQKAAAYADIGGDRNATPISGGSVARAGRGLASGNGKDNPSFADILQKAFGKMGEEENFDVKNGIQGFKGAEYGAGRGLASRDSRLFNLIHDRYQTIDQQQGLSY